MSAIAKREGIRIEGRYGRWYVIDERDYDGETLYLVESANDGDSVPAMVINSDLDVLFDDAWNGFDDYDDFLEEEEF